MRRALLAVRPWLPQPIFTALGNAEARLRKLNTAPATRQTIDTELRRRLDEEFAPEVERLSALLGRDLTGWSRDARWHNDIETSADVPEPALPTEVYDGRMIGAA